MNTKEFNINAVLAKYPDLDRGLKKNIPGYEEIVKDRYERILELDGKFIIVKTNKDTSLFYQREELQQGRYKWTRYPANAVAFDTEKEALDYAIDAHVLHYSRIIQYVV